MYFASVLLAVLMCCPPMDEPQADGAEGEEAEVQVCEKVNVLLPDGTPAPEQLAGTAKDGLMLRLEFIPALLDVDEFDRPIKPLEEWRIAPMITDANGNQFTMQMDFYSYDVLGYCTTGQPLFDLTEVHWVSPEAPKSMQPGWVCRWGFVDLPETAGDYHLTVTVYPTADPDWPPGPGQPAIVNPQLGEGSVIFEAMVSVEAAQHVGNTTSFGTFANEQTREYIRAELKRVGE